jgi:hypothetical protein
VKECYDKLYLADDYIIYETMFGTLRIGYSKKADLYLSYFWDNDKLFVYKTAEGFKAGIFGHGNFSNYESGCSCDDCVQSFLDGYSTKNQVDYVSVENLREYIMTLFVVVDE